MSLIVQERRIPPARGLTPMHNAKGRPFKPIDLKRYVRLNRIAFKTHKVDLLANAAALPMAPELIACAGEFDMRASLRMVCDGAPPDLSGFARAGLLDVFLCAARLERDGLREWLSAAHQAGLPIRLQMQVPLPADLDPAIFLSDLRAHGVNVLNIAVSDPFMPGRSCETQTRSERNIELMARLARKGAEHDIEVNLLGLPLCVTPPECLRHTVNSHQFYFDHQHYHRGSYQLAQQIFANGPARVGMALQMLIGRYTLQYSRIDTALMPWLLNHPWAYSRIWAWHKLTRVMRAFQRRPKEIGNSREAYEREAARAQKEAMKTMGPICAGCSLNRICDHGAGGFGRVMPGIPLAAQQGPSVTSPLHFALEQPKYYDAADETRRTLHDDAHTLAKRAESIVINQPPTRQIAPFDYTVENAFYQQLEGGVRWHSVTNTEKLSSPLAKLDPPFTVSVSFGGGIAELMGFSFGRHCKLLCPMESYRHELILHVEADGHFVLLRDGKPIEPVEFEGAHYVPLRLGQGLELRISLWNIDGSVVTQFIKIWERAAPRPIEVSCVKYSVLVVTSRYARRLQAVLQSIAHQKDFDPGRVEVVVAYVPGIDATDDVLDSVSLAHPELRIVRSPFPQQNANSKGFMINESVRAAAGEWIVLLDSDILVPPDFFAALENHTGEDVYFLAPDGRKMLDKAVTARVLLGEIEPWRQWEELLAGAGEYRYREAKGVPIGFCQCVRAECFKDIKYEELEHFEGADMWFGMNMRWKHGKELRLSGMPVLHLDHGGSQWYGTKRHF